MSNLVVIAEYEACFLTDAAHTQKLESVVHVASHSVLQYSGERTDYEARVHVLYILL